MRDKTLDPAAIKALRVALEEMEKGAAALRNYLDSVENGWMDFAVVHPEGTVYLKSPAVEAAMRDHLPKPGRDFTWVTAPETVKDALRDVEDEFYIEAVEDDKTLGTPKSQQLPCTYAITGTSRWDDWWEQRLISAVQIPASMSGPICCPRCGNEVDIVPFNLEGHAIGSHLGSTNDFLIQQPICTLSDVPVEFIQPTIEVSDA